MDQLNYRLPKSKKGQKTFDRIVHTAKFLFSKNGYHNTPINDIIAKSKIATGTFYIYFDDKLALYTHILMQYRKSIRAFIHKKIKNATTRYEKERLGIKAFLQFAWIDPLSYKIIWESLFINEAIFKDYYQRFANDYIRQLNASKDELQPVQDFETIAYMLMGISNFVGLQVLFKSTLTETRLDEIVDQVMTILKRGMFK